MVHLITAGIEQAIEPLAQRLGADSLRAVRLRFASNGDYEGFEPTPLTHSSGKELIIRDIRERTPGRAALIGDGASDLAARPAVDLFIGFGGVHIRQRVKDNAGIYIEQPDLTAILPLLLD